MPIGISSSEIAVLLLYDLDPTWATKDQEEVIRITSQLGKAIVKAGYRMTLVPITNGDIDSVLSNFDPLKHIVFNWCENIPGIKNSEWLVAHHLERRGFTFTGASTSSMTLAQDKCRIKKLLYESGIPTPLWQKFNKDTAITWEHYPAIVKLSRGHCSEGIDRNSVCTTETELRNRIRYVTEKYQQPAIVEGFIDGRELHISLWGNGNIEILPPAEMEFSLLNDLHDRLCTYESKFVLDSEQNQKIRTILPALLSEHERRYVERICRSAYRISGCRDYARIDVRMKNGLMYVLDVNPNPDISQDTSTVMSANLKGHTYKDFGDHIIRLAAHRHPVWGKE
ncbi:MAG: ATP-grasp domain-containing protein [Paludibacter sp.]|nr:ATP-grasp domain-containing protein [Paludibacter sp.]